MDVRPEHPVGVLNSSTNLRKLGFFGGRFCPVFSESETILGSRGLCDMPVYRLCQLAEEWCWSFGSVEAISLKFVAS